MALDTNIDAAAVKQQIINLLNRLSIFDLQHVLAYIERLPKRPEGIPTEDFIAFLQEAHTKYDLTPEDEEEMARFFEELS